MKILMTMFSITLTLTYSISISSIYADDNVIVRISSADQRTWTSIRGNKLTASFLSKSNSVVQLIDHNGQVFKIKEALLSDSDRNYIINLTPKYSPPVNKVYSGQYYETEDDRRKASKDWFKMVKRSNAIGSTWQWAPTKQELIEQGFTIRNSDDEKSTHDIAVNPPRHELPEMENNLRQDVQSRESSDRAKWQESARREANQSLFYDSNSMEAHRIRQRIDSGGYTETERYSIDLMNKSEILMLQQKKDIEKRNQSLDHTSW